jgi:Effector Associated Constant Component 1
VRQTFSMNVELSAGTAAEPLEAEVLSLRDWLLRESPSLGRIRTVTSTGEPETMGALTDTLQVALGTGGAGAMLAGSVATWLSTRRADLKLRLKRPDGKELEVDAQVKAPEELIARFLSEAGDVAH